MDFGAAKFLIRTNTNIIWTVVSQLCELEADLSNVPKEPLDRCKNSKGQTYYKEIII